MNFSDFIRTVPDFPMPGIMFRDITTLLGNADAFSAAIDQLAAPYVNSGIDTVAGIEARGFILGGAIARRLGASFAPVRKSGKLPWRTIKQEYQLEYGVDALELHQDALAAGERVLLIDDLIATGGTALAALALIEHQGAEIVGAGFVIDLPDLGGADLLRARSMRVDTLCTFEGH